MPFGPAVVGMSLVFTQTAALGVRELAKEADRRGFRLTPADLQALHRAHVLSPVIELASRRIADPIVPDVEPDSWLSSRRSALRDALAKGAYRDSATDTDRNRARIAGLDRGRFLYSRWQLLDAHLLRRVLGQARIVGPRGRSRLVLPSQAPEPWSDRHSRALVVEALAPRYLPVLDPEWRHLVNVEDEDWTSFVSEFEPSTMLARLGVSPEDLYRWADQLLLSGSRIDPLGNWSRLVRRAPHRAWKSLRGDALIANEHRIAAEVLMLCAEAVDGRVIPPMSERGMVWHPEDERISAARDVPLDRLLSELGISPHPGVLLMLEGETERRLAERLFDHMSLRRSPDLVRIVNMQSEDTKLHILAAAMIAPHISAPRKDGYDLSRTPTKMVVVVDANSSYSDPEVVERERDKLVEVTASVLRAQGVTDADSGDLEYLVEFSTWTGEFEFDHFTDEQLAAALESVHPDCNGQSFEQLVQVIGSIRSDRKGAIKNVWKGWKPTPSKVKLADALWPVLKDAVDAAATFDELPPLAQVVQNAYHDALSFTIGSFVLGRGQAPNP